MNRSADILFDKINQVDWADWTPVWTITPKKKKLPRITPHDFQETHSPSKAVSKTTRQRILDARLWNSLSPHAQEAAMRIERTCHIMNKGLGFRISSPHKERVSGNRPQTDDAYHNHLTDTYMKWARACQEEHLSHAACLDILVFGKSCASVDKARKVRKGWARQNLDACLGLYCKLKGWPA